MKMGKASGVNGSWGTVMSLVTGALCGEVRSGSMVVVLSSSRLGEGSPHNQASAGENDVRYPKLLARSSCRR